MIWKCFRVIIRPVKDFYYWMSFWTLFQLFIFFQSIQWKRTATNTLSYVLLYQIAPSTKIAYKLEVFIGSDCTGRCKSKLTMQSRPRQQNNNNIVVHQFGIKAGLPFLTVSLRTSIFVDRSATVCLSSSSWAWSDSFWIDIALIPLVQ